MTICHCFVREEGDQLILCQGIAPRWLDAGTPLEFGPAPTACGACRTDLHIVDGDLIHPDRPIVRGHEIIGEALARLRDGRLPGVAVPLPGQA